MCTPSFSPVKRRWLKVKQKLNRSGDKLTNEIELHKALAELEDAFEASILGVCRTLQREEVNEEI
jgi:hypothetical protein